MMVGSSGNARARTPRAETALELDVDGLRVQMQRKRVKNMNLRVAADGQVRMSVPYTVPLREAEEFVRAHASWIAAQQAKQAQRPMVAARAASADDQQQWRDVVSAFVPLLVAKWEPVLGVRAGALAYRSMNSRWGSCQPATGRICINTRLALYPPECLEYVVVHELCHLREHGHTPAFWALVESCLPNWRAARARLRD